MNTIQLISRTRDELRSGREARAARRALVRDLEPYQTQAEVSELLALVSDRDDAAAEQFRSVLMGNLTRHQQATPLAS